MPTKNKRVTVSISEIDILLLKSIMHDMKTRQLSKALHLLIQIYLNRKGNGKDIL